MERTRRGIAVLLGLLVVASAGGAVPAPRGSGDAALRVVGGSDVVSRTAASSLRDALAERGIAATTADAPLDPGHGPGTVLVGTPDDHPAIAARHRVAPFGLDHPEGFHVRRDGSSDEAPLWIVGATPKGAMNGVFRYLDMGAPSGALDVSAEPVFDLRIAGHEFVQTAPPDWSEDDQGEFYARNYLNVVWGEKKGPPLSAETRQRWGLGLMLEQRLPPVEGAWMDDPANASAVYWRDTWSGQRRVVSPFDPLGRQAHLDAFTAALDANPDTRILYSLFGDYSFTTDGSSVRVSDGQPCGCTHEDSIREVMEIMAEAIGIRDVTPAVWMWHLFPAQGDHAFMEELSDAGYGVIHNEAGNGDDWVFKRENFDANALRTAPAGGSAYGDDFAVLVSAGGSCESTEPTIGLPTPHAAATKLAALADAGVRNVVLWWGSAEGWVYQPNLRVLAEMVWDPAAFDADDPDPFDPADPEPLLSSIATADFGEHLGEKILEFWGAVDAAIVSPGPAGEPAGMPVYSWYQRLGNFTNRGFLRAYPVPLTPDRLADRDRFSSMFPWGVEPQAIADWERVTTDLRTAADIAWNLRMNSGAGVQELVDMHLQVALLQRMLTSQLHLMQGLRVMEDHTGLPPEDPAIRQALAAIVDAEIINTAGLESLVAQFPTNFNLGESHEGVVRGWGDRDAEIDLLADKRVVMELWRDEAPNRALGATATASSVEKSDRTPDRAVDGDHATMWHSEYRDDEWFQLDLGSVQPVDVVVLHWAQAFGDQYELLVATDAAGPWTSVATEQDGDGGTDVIGVGGVQARHVRFEGISRGAPWGYAIREFEVY